MKLYVTVLNDIKEIRLKLERIELTTNLIFYNAYQTMLLSSVEKRNRLRFETICWKTFLEALDKLSDYFSRNELKKVKVVANENVEMFNKGFKAARADFLNRPKQIFISKVKVNAS